ncbi:hypothetical protein D3C85_1011860 [compost metagenome]
MGADALSEHAGAVGHHIGFAAAGGQRAIILQRCPQAHGPGTPGGNRGVVQGDRGHLNRLVTTCLRRGAMGIEAECFDRGALGRGVGRELTTDLFGNREHTHARLAGCGNAYAVERRGAAIVRPGAHGREPRGVDDRVVGNQRAAGVTRAEPVSVGGRPDPVAAGRDGAAVERKVARQVGDGTHGVVVAGGGDGHVVGRQRPWHAGHAAGAQRRGVGASGRDGAIADDDVAAVPGVDAQGHGGRCCADAAVAQCQGRADAFHLHCR